MPSKFQAPRKRKYGTPDGLPVSRKRLRAAMATLADRTLMAHRVAPETIQACLSDIRGIATARDVDPVTRRAACQFLVDHGWRVYEHEHPTQATPPPPPIPQKIQIKILRPGVPSANFSKNSKGVD